MTLAEKFQTIEGELNNRFIERHDPIRGLIVSLLAKKHLLILGPPGTAKSWLAREVSVRIKGCQYFEYLLTRFTTPEEIFGPFSLKALEDDRYYRITNGKLPRAHIAFIDEIYKGSSAIANTMLSAINERLFHNNNVAEAIPLQTVIGASNELPSESEELAAFHDRFLLKYEVKYVVEPGGFLKMLEHYEVPAERTEITLDELKEAQDQVKQIKVSKEVRELIQKVRFELQKNGIIVSDRVFNTSQDLIRAEAWLMGMVETIPETMAICQHAYWDEPRKARDVKMTVLRASSKEMLEIEQAHEEAQDLIRPKTKMDEDLTEVKESLETRKKLAKVIKVMQDHIPILEKKKLPVFKYQSMLIAAKFRLQQLDSALTGNELEEVLAAYKAKKK
jgi:MoxR-like ATPase